MDHFYFGDVTVDTFIETVRDPTRPRASWIPNGSIRLTRALRDLDKMIVFVLAFDDFLCRCEESPVFADRAWEYFGYWFPAMRREFGKSFFNAMLAIETWDDALLRPEEREDRLAHCKSVEAAAARVVFRNVSAF